MDKESINVLDIQTTSSTMIHVNLRSSDDSNQYDCFQFRGLHISLYPVA